jgi:hypothetical protein
MSTGYDWSPLFNAFNGAIQRNSDQNQYQNLLSTLVGQGTPTPQTYKLGSQQMDIPAMTTEGGATIGGNSISTPNNLSVTPPAVNGQYGPGTPMSYDGGLAKNMDPRIVSMLQGMNPKIGMPLLLASAKTALTPTEYDATPRTGVNPDTGQIDQFVMSKDGKQKWLNTAPQADIERAPGGQLYDKHSGKQMGFANDPNQPMGWGGDGSVVSNAGYQNYQRSLEAQKQAPQWANAAETNRHNLAVEGDTGGGLSDGAKVNAAVKFNATGSLPPMGMGQAARKDRLEVLNYAAELAKGTPPEQLVANAANYKANSRALGQITNQFNLIEQNSNTARNSAGLALQAARAGGAGPTGSPALNRWIQAGRKSVAGDQDVMALDNHLSTFAEDYAKVMTASTGSQAATDSARGEAYKRLSSANNTPQLEHIMGEMFKEMGGRHYAARAQIQSIQGQLSGKQYSEPNGVQTPANLPGSTPGGGTVRGVKYKILGGGN